jgi:DeoR family fructose operon transcriptional repressor
MYPFERKEKIVANLKSAGKIMIDEEARLLGVSPATIYRDIEGLEKQGLVKKVRGGAIFMGGQKRETHFDLRMKTNIKEKEAIARKAADLIQDDSSIFLDHSSTAVFLARELKNRDFRNLTLLTNSLALPYEMGSVRGIRLVLTGGVVENEFEALTGHWVVDSLRTINLHQLFASVGAVSPERGLMTQIPFIYELLPAIFRLAHQINILVDYSKFSKIGSYHIAPLDSALTLISDKNLADPIKLAIEKTGAKLIT